LFLEIGHRGFVALQDLSPMIFDALNAILPNEDFHLVRRVHAFEGWGDIHYVNIYSGIRRHEAGPALEGAIRTIVDNVLHGRRHVVCITWAI
jgi:hypothetical protein